MSGIPAQANCTPLEAEFAAQILQQRRTIRQLEIALEESEKLSASLRTQLDQIFIESQSYVTGSNNNEAVLLIDKLISGESTIADADFLPRLRELCTPTRWTKSEFSEALNDMRMAIAYVNDIKDLPRVKVAWLKLQRVLGYKVTL